MGGSGGSGYLADWELHQRDKADIVRCCAEAGISGSAIDIEEDRTVLTLIIKCASRLIRESGEALASLPK
jgi:hypothetical protein